MQRDSMQCGVACLTAVARYFGARYTTVNDIDKVCHATTEGVSMQALRDGASKIGMRTAAGRLKIDRLVFYSGYPMILHWDQNHFVVLYRVSRKGRRFHIFDPGKGRITYKLEDFLRHWAATTADDGQPAGIAMVLYPDSNFKVASKADRRRHSSLRRLWPYMEPFKKHFVHLILGLVLGCVLQLIMPFMTQAIVDIGIHNKSIGFIWLVLLGELMIVLGRTATDFVRRWLLLHISVRVNIALVSAFFRKLIRLPMTFFDTKLTGDIIQRMSDHARVQNFLTNETLGVTFSMLSFVIFGAVLAFYNWLIFGVFVGGSALYAMWLMMFMRRRKVLDYEIFELQARNQNQTYQFVTTMQEIKLQGCDNRRRHEWEDTQMDLLNVQMRSLRLRQTQEAGGIFINELKNIVITVLAASAVITGNISLGAMLAIQYIIGQLNSPVDQLMNFILSLQDMKLSLERINEIHNLPAENENRYKRLDDKRNKVIDPDRSITLDNISFRYDPHAPADTLSDINLKIPQGRVTAIVGASGSGKTTLVKLMLAYFDDMKGKIGIGSHDLMELDPTIWRDGCGVVMQEGVIFSDSIAHNIATAGYTDIDLERLEHAARVACIHDFIMGLPLRYETKIGRDGVGLSLGQRQRILIARAVYKNPDFIFLDEATNSLDAANEHAIVENLRDFYKGRTVVVVAHRLSTVRDADQIVVLDKGRIVEQGTHDSLVEAHGHYYNLIKNQLELGA